MEGKAFSHFPFRVVYSLQPGSEPAVLQAGFTVSTRYFKKAVDRNRVKRQMREAYRLQKQGLHDALVASGQSLALFFIYTGNVLPEYQVVADKTGTALKRLQKIAGESRKALPNNNEQ